MSEDQGRNYGLKEEIRAFWSDRAATFDRSPAHRIDEGNGVPEWDRLIREARNLTGDQTLAGETVLDLACGTGEVSRVLLGLGASVVGADFSETMLAQARRKLAGRAWKGFHCDAETLQLMGAGEFDMLITRHLVWTLTDPAQAFARWREVLKPGGTLIVIDGDWASPATPLERMGRLLVRLLGGAYEEPEETKTRHGAILTRLPYAKGLTAALLSAQLAEAGFSQIRVLPVGRLYGRGMRHLPPADRLRLRLGAGRRFALVAR